jgi:hypothetical protein
MTEVNILQLIVSFVFFFAVGVTCGILLMFKLYKVTWKDEPNSEDAVAAERKRSARVAANFSMKPDRSIHPDIRWEEMSESARTVAHTTAQQIAAEILEPDRKED